MKLLIIEDDLQLLNLLKTQLEKAHYLIDTAVTGEDAVYQATEFAYDCIILDIGLPDMNGFDVCRSIRNAKNTTPILILTARDAVEDRIQGLDLGADEYVTKPIDFSELLARVRALIRRNSTSALPIIEVGNLMIDPSKRIVTRDGNAINLNSKEFAVLEYLARHSGEVVTRSMIMEHVWGSDFETLSNVVDVYIRYLRRKIDTTGLSPLIHTIRGGGYSLSDKR